MSKEDHMRNGQLKAAYNIQISTNKQFILHYYTKKGIKLRKQRCHDVEPVFAELKHNKNFKRFMLRGKTKVEVEIGILAIAHNLKKMAKAA